MRWSHIFIPTLRDDPADAEAISHKLLVRGGFVRQLMSGVYSLLPLGFRVCQKIQGTRVLPSPVFISAIMPLCSTMPPNS